MSRMILDVPFHCQRDLETVEGIPPPIGPAGPLTWADRGCAIASLTMVLNFWGRCSRIDEVLAVALRHGAYDPVRGWLHGGLVQVLQRYGLAACRRNWRLLDGNESAYLAGRPQDTATVEETHIVRQQMQLEGLETVRAVLARGAPVVTSVYRPLGDRSSLGHQIVLLAVENSTVVFHEPAERNGAYQRWSIETFLSTWKSTAVLAADQAEVLALAPIQVERTDQPLVAPLDGNTHMHAGRR
jgi:hypothetical protein